MEERIGNFGNPKAQRRRRERQDNDQDRQPSRRPTAVKDAAFFSGKGCGGNNNAVEGQQRQSL
jgi:hypothetical protein